MTLGKSNIHCLYLGSVSCSYNKWCHSRILCDFHFHQYSTWRS